MAKSLSQDKSPTKIIKKYIELNGKRHPKKSVIADTSRIEPTTSYAKGTCFNYGATEPKRCGTMSKNSNVYMFTSDIN